MGHQEYLSAGVHIGMKQQTKDMKRFIYKIRPDGLAVMNVQLIEERVNIAAKFLSKFKKIVVVSRKLIGQKAAVKFAEATDSKAFIGRFLPGTITNPNFPGYFEPDIVIVTDPFADKQAIEEALKMRKPVIAFCDTFNETPKIDFIIPCNNRGRRSIALLYYTLAKKIFMERGGKEEDFKYKPEDFEIENDRKRRD